MFVPGATQYIVTAKNTEDLDEEQIVFDNGNEVSAEITKLNPGIIYSFQVKTVNKNQNMMSMESREIKQRTSKLQCNIYHIPCIYT